MSTTTELEERVQLLGYARILLRNTLEDALQNRKGWRAQARKALELTALAKSEPSP